MFRQYHKSIGAFLMIIAFVMQWTSTRYLDPINAATFSDTNDAISELEDYELESLYHLTKDVKYLDDALDNRARRFADWLRSPVYESIGDERFRPVLNATLFEPKTFEEYAREKDKLNKAVGRYWGEHFISGAGRISRLYDYFQLATFAISLLGLLLIWSGENLRLKDTNGEKQEAEEPVESVRRDA